MHNNKVTGPARLRLKGVRGGMAIVGIMFAAGTAFASPLVGTNDFKGAPRSQFSDFVAKDSGVVSGKTVTYSGTAPVVVMAVSPAEFPNPSFRVEKLDNPTLKFRAGAKIQFTFINGMHDFSHSLQITKKGPPYGVTLDIAPVLAGTEFSPPATTRRFYYANFTWRPAAGTYHYLCVIPGHAAMGMFGKIVVQ